MKVSILGGGAWGVTLAQVLLDNDHEVLVYDIKKENVDAINSLHHPFFNNVLPSNIKATTSISEVREFSNTYVISVPTKFIPSLLDTLNPLTRKSLFINVSKGIDPDNLESISDVVKRHIDKKYLIGYVNLTGPSHAEEVIDRKLTLLVASSKDTNLAKDVQKLFSNTTYIRVYTSNDVIGSEVCASAKNAIAVISGIISSVSSTGENARAALLTRGLKELVLVIKHLGGNKKTAYGLTGIGDLIVTATSLNSRNFRCGIRLGKGDSLETIYAEEKQTIEGIRSIEALHKLSLKYNFELPIISAAYDLIFNHLPVKECIEKLLLRDLTKE